MVLFVPVLARRRFSSPGPTRTWSLPQPLMRKRPAVMGPGPELDGNLSPNRSGRVPKGDPTPQRFVPCQEGGPRTRPDSRMGGNHLPGRVGTVAHDGGISRFLGFFT